MMKIYTSLLVLATLVTLSTCMLLYVPGVAEKCRLDNNATEEELDKLYQELSEDTDTVDRRFKCYTNCLYNGLKLTDDNGRLDAIKFVNQDPTGTNKEHVVEVANECNAKYASVEEKCENIFKVVVCIHLQLQHEEEEAKVYKLIRNNFNTNETE